ncbi:MAG: NAD(P)H-dependent oxidoreductase [Pseudomonadota bacterium]
MAASIAKSEPIAPFRPVTYTKHMTTLVVLAHPLPGSLNAHIAQHVITQLDDKAKLVDLYDSRFDPVLRAPERDGYYTGSFEDTDGLQACTRLILIFPTWWSGMPAMLKGWIDRRFMPGVAFDHADDLTALSGRLHRLRHMVVITTCGGPWWIDRLILRQPVKKALKLGLMKPCAPGARFHMLSLYGAETATDQAVAAFQRRIDRVLSQTT